MFIINIILVAYTERASDSRIYYGDQGADQAITGLGSILLILSIFVYIFNVVENYPLTLYDYIHRERESDIYSSPMLNKLKGTVLMEYYVETMGKDYQSNSLSLKSKVFIILKAKNNFINFMYVLISCFALK